MCEKFFQSCMLAHVMVMFSHSQMIQSYKLSEIQYWYILIVLFHFCKNVPRYSLILMMVGYIVHRNLPSVS